MEAAGKSSRMGGRRHMKSGNTGSSPEECPVCLAGYDGSVRRPSTLPCGHTACMLCLDQLKVQGHVICPECHVSHTVPEGGQFPVCYAVEALIRMLRDAEVTQAAVAAALPPLGTVEGKRAAATEAGQNGSAGLSQKMHSFLQPRPEADPNSTIMDRLRLILPPRLTTPEVLRSLTQPARRLVEGAEEALETATTEEPGSQAERDSTITDRLFLTLEPSFTPEVLCSQMQPVRRLVEVGRVVAVHQAEGPPRHARISLEAGQMCLHALKDLPPPPGAATLQLSEVVPPSPPCNVFLDLSWPGSAPRRVQICLSPDTPLGRQFLLLCTGQRGPSYVNTRLFAVVKQGMAGEYVGGGDYESNEGYGSCVLLPGLARGDYQESRRAGAVFGWVLGEDGKFGIRTKDCWGNGFYPAFGVVVDGLHVVAEGAQRRDIKEVTVVDCGVVLLG